VWKPSPCSEPYSLEYGFVHHAWVIILMVRFGNVEYNLPKTGGFGLGRSLISSCPWFKPISGHRTIIGVSLWWEEASPVVSIFFARNMPAVGQHAVDDVEVAPCSLHFWFQSKLFTLFPKTLNTLVCLKRLLFWLIPKRYCGPTCSYVKYLSTSYRLCIKYTKLQLTKNTSLFVWTE
jgi:hypothetical protein